MRLREILDSTRKSLAICGVTETHIESELLIRHILHCSKAQMFLALDDEIDANIEQEINRVIKRRLNGEYLNYITGEREFYGNTFTLNPSVLIPRPETEVAVEVALNYTRLLQKPVIADIGTGSGVIAISLAKHLPHASIYAIDISALALSVARENARRHRVEERIYLYQGDLLEPLPETVDIVIANLPYIPSSEVAETREPRLALDGGIDGLCIISRLCRQLPAKLKKGGIVILEVGDDQAKAVSAHLEVVFPLIKINVARDLAGFERVVYGVT